jgi:hypothetical protein
VVSAATTQIRGSAVLFVGRVLALLISLATQVLLVRSLSKAGSSGGASSAGAGICWSAPPKSKSSGLVSGAATGWARLSSPDLREGTVAAGAGATEGVVTAWRAAGWVGLIGCQAPSSSLAAFFPLPISTTKTRKARSPAARNSTARA